MTSILGLDLGTKLGWAVISNNHGQEHIESGAQDFTPEGHQGVGARGHRLRVWLHHLHQTHKFERLVWEEINFNARNKKGFTVGRNNAIVYGGIVWTVTAWAHYHGIPYEGVQPQTIRKHVFGNGGYKKPECHRILRDVMGYSHSSGDEADAIAVALYAIGHFRQRSLLDAAGE